MFPLGERGGNLIASVRTALPPARWPARTEPRGGYLKVDNPRRRCGITDEIQFHGTDRTPINGARRSPRSTETQPARPTRRLRSPASTRAGGGRVTRPEAVAGPHPSGQQAWEQRSATAGADPLRRPYFGGASTYGSTGQGRHPQADSAALMPTCQSVNWTQAAPRFGTSAQRKGGGCRHRRRHGKAGTAGRFASTPPPGGLCGGDWRACVASYIPLATASSGQPAPHSRGSGGLHASSNCRELHVSLPRSNTAQSASSGRSTGIRRRQKPADCKCGRRSRQATIEGTTGSG